MSYPYSQSDMTYDPQARKQPVRPAVTRSVADRRLTGARGKISDGGQAHEPLSTAQSDVSAVSSRRIVPSRENMVRERSSQVVPASAIEPARLPPLKTEQAEFDLTSSRNPLRDK
ncbi:MAG: hypothetical protein IT423_09170 [Pirellulaceae bacterium]|nr:hypothetical protein [Pirellulaceae bacterium]